MLPPPEVNGAVLTIPLDRPIDGRNCPQPAAFTLTVSGVAEEGAFNYVGCDWRGSLTLHLSSHVRVVEGGITRYRVRQRIPVGETATVSYDKTRAQIVAPGGAVGKRLTYADDGSEVPSFTKNLSNLTPGPPRGPEASRASVDVRTLTLAFDKALDEGSVPAGGAFRVFAFHGGGHGVRPCNGVCTVAVSEVSVSGAEAVLTLAEPIPSSASVALVYEAPDSNPLQGAEYGAQAPVKSFRLANNRVSVLTPDTAPVFQAATVRQGKYLWVNFNEPLVRSATPGTTFKVTATRNGRTRTIAGTGTAKFVGAYSSSVSMTLASAVAAGEKLTLSYAKPSATPLRDRGGIAVESFSGMPLTNGRPRIEAVAIVSEPLGGNGDTYGRGDTVRVRVSFDVPVIVDTRRGVPRLKLDLVPGTFRGGYDEKWAAYEGGTGTDALTFAYTVRAGHPYDIASVGLELPANGLEPNGGRITSTSSFGSPAETADLSYAGLDRDPAHKVDARTVSPPPAPAGAFWSAVLTVKSTRSDINAVGCGSEAEPCSSALTDDSFTREGTSYRVTQLGTYRINNAPFLVVSLDKPIPSSWTLQVGDRMFPIADDDPPADTATWSNPGLNLSVGDEVPVWLSAPSGDGPAGPAFRSAEVNGKTLSLLFDEALDPRSVPVSGDFYVTVGDARRGVAAGGVVIDGATVRLTLVSAVSEDDTVTVRYAKGANPLRDRAGDEAESFPFTDRPVTWVAGPPLFVSAEVNGAALALTFDQDLDGDSVPAPGRFHVTVGGARRAVVSGGVAIDGKTVTLTLATAVAYGETGVMVRYSKGANPLRNAAGFEVASFADQAVDNVTPDPDVLWSATLTVESFGSERGCSDGAVSAHCTILLSPNTFTYPADADETYQVTLATLFRGRDDYPWALSVGLNKEWPATLRENWVLEFHGTLLSFTDATTPDGWLTANWSPTDIDSNIGTDKEVTLRLLRPADDPGAQANSGPSFHSASVNGDRLSVTFDEPLDEDATPDGDSFGVTTLPDGGSGQGDRSGRRTTQGQGGTSSGTGATSVEGRTVTVTLDRPVAPGDRVFVSYDPPDENAIRDREGGEAEGFSGRPAAHAPAVTAVAVVSDAGGDDTYALGDTIRVRVTFAEKVNVDTADGTPRLTIKMDPTWGEFRASYAGGSGTKALTFTHTVAEPNTSPRGIAVLANTLELNGGTIRSEATGADADLAHTGLGHDAKHKVNWRIQPSDVTAVAVVSDAGSDDTYALGDTIRVRVTFAGKANVDTAGGTPRLKIKMDPTWGEFWAAYAGGDGTANLVFTHTVAQPNTSPRGIAVLANTLQANGGAIRLAATNANARLPHAGLGHDPAHKVNWRISPPVASAPPGAPTGVSVQDASNTGLSVSWTAPSDTGSAAIAGYELRWHAGASDPGDASAWTETGDVGTGTTATIADLAADTAYRVQVRARGAGKGPWSASGAGRTQAAGDTTPPVPESATVNWRAVTVTFDEDLVAVGAGASLNFWFTVTGGGAQQHPVRATASGRTVTMELGAGSPARAGRSYTIGYYGNGPLKDAAGNAVVEFGGLAAENLTQPRLSVADAKAHEGTDASMDFAVTLDAAMDEAVTVDYATADGSATAGEDYTAASGTLTFAAGERSKTVSVAILDDAIDEGKETLRLRLSNAQGAVIEDGEAVGTITNSDPLQKMWLSRFGRTVADHVTGAVSDRLSAPLAGAQVTVGGQTVNLAEVGDEARLGEALTSVARALGAPSGPGPANDPGLDPLGSDPLRAGPGDVGADSWPGIGLGAAEAPTLASAAARSVTGGELLVGSAFHLAMDGDGAGPGLAAWGRVTAGRFDGEAPADSGNVRIDGDVMTGILGTDAEWGRVLAGVALSLSDGEGTFDQRGVDSGTVESTMTTVSPYARVTLSERLSAWGLAGVGTGDITIVQAANAATGQPERMTRTDLAMRLAALGGRGALLQADQAGGFDLALRGDAFFVETESDAVAGEGATTADASRVRLVLEGSRAFVVGDGVITPGLELGLRHDGGDAETGTGVELGGRVSWTDPGTGLSLEASVRALVAHEDEGYEEWGASGALRLAPGDAGRGLSFSLAPTYGAPSSGVDRLWSARDAGGLGAAGGTFEPESRLAGELGYGVALPGGFMGTPNVGFAVANGTRDYRVGWRLTPAGAAGFEVNLDATRRESAILDGADAAPVEHGVLLRGALRW